MSARNITSDRKRSRPVTKRRRIDNKYVIGIIVVVIAVVAIVSIYFFIEPSNDENNVTVGNPIAVIDTSKGTIRVELYTNELPNTCENFIKLANDGFYDGLVFHRVIPSFMIQGGGFKADGSQIPSPYGTIDLEINLDVRHVEGAISMARTPDPNSASSQFFICEVDRPDLDDDYRQENYGERGYAAFGKTIDGMDVVRAIASVTTTTKYGMQNWPVEDVFINSITIENQ
ncbi:MAG: peptidylprolyl isomerase [Candidatus Hodarchaeota archaeon]